MPFVCPECFGDSVLKRRIRQIRPQYGPNKCTFHPRFKGIPTEHVAGIVDEVFRSHYSLGDYNSWDGEQEGDDLASIVSELTRADDHSVAQAVADQLIEDDDYWPPDGGEPFYASDLNYVFDFNSGEFNRNSIAWRKFCDGILHEQRFFSSEAKSLISELFRGIENQKDLNRQSPVYVINPGDKNSIFVRARVIDSDAGRKKAKEYPTTELGPPPRRLRRAGRMNPAGVACFYGAFQIETCIAELRPAVGSIVVSGKFTLKRAIHVLDTTRFEAPIKPMSIFSADYLARVEQWTFMKKFMKEISKPVSPNDEYLDYIPTQAVAEYLVRHHLQSARKKEYGIDAVIYQSAQIPGKKNIAILGDAAEIITPPSNTRASATPNTDIQLFEYIDPLQKRKYDQRPPSTRVYRWIYRGS
jgi:hypothetical protein